jgi:AraC family transcriptional activator of pobA
VSARRTSPRPHRTSIARADAAGPGPVIAERIQTADGGAALPVTHDFAALAFYLLGSARIEQRGLWTLRAGDLLIVPAGEPHRAVDANNVDAWRAAVCVPCLASDIAGAPLDPFDRVRGGASPVVRIPVERRPFLASLFEELARPGGSPKAVTAVQVSLLTLIIREIKDAADWSPDAAPERTLVSDILGYIERHCLGPLTLADIARAIHRSPSYITTVLTRATGRSAGAWILAGRMAEARRRLLHSDERVDVIGERVGYADPTHFIRTFRRVHGSTPAAWRTLRRGV